jgi:hypothetical protein
MAELRTQIQELSQRMATLSMEMGDAGPRAYAFRYIGDPDRAIIGVVLGKNDKEVLINAVTEPGGTMLTCAMATSSLPSTARPSLPAMVRQRVNRPGPAVGSQAGRQLTIATGAETSAPKWN